jgi:hypothetical protein
VGLWDVSPNPQAAKTARSNMRMSRFLQAGAMLVLCAPMLALADCPPCPKAKVKVTFVVILASEDGDAVDKRLKDIAQEVRKLNPSLSSFRLKTMTSKSLPPEEKVKFDTVEDKATEITVRHGADKENRVSLAVTAPGQGEIVYRTVCGKFLPIVTRYHTKSKERLILAIRM